jgi:hypothetical protein
VCYGLRMRTRYFWGLFMLTWILGDGFYTSSHAEVVDRILAVVNDEIIALSDVKTYQTFFGEGRDTQATLDDLIDQKLLFKEAQKFRLDVPSEEAVEDEYHKLEARLGGRDVLAETLKPFALTEQDLLDQIQARMIVTQLIDQRVNFFIFVPPNEVEDYYKKHADEFSGRPLDQVRSEIQDLIIERKGKRKRKDYIDRLRARATIQMN